MMTDSKNNLFLKQSYEDSWNEFKYMLENTKPVRWDWFVITASNEEQAVSYRMQIDYRIKNRFLPSGTKYVVIPDPEGKRVGSGGATLNALKYIKENSADEDAFQGKRIVIIHSGGDSKRIPQYSACGKLFSKVPRSLPDGRCSTLFDEFVISLSGVPNRMKDGLLVISGDVLLLFNPLQIDLQREGSACISMKAPVEVGVNHGVFLPDTNGEVKEFLHKQTKETLVANGAVNEQNNVDIDTGAIWIGSGVINELLALISKNHKIDKALFDQYVNDKIRLSFYGDFLFPMVTSATLEAYLEEPSEGQRCEELIECRKAIYQILHKFPMFLIRLSPAEFIHFGTTKELLSLMLSAEKRYSFLSWSKRVLSENEFDIASINCMAEKGAKVSADCYFEDSFIDKGSEVGQGSIISNTNFCGKLNENMVIHSLPVSFEGNEGFVTRIYGVYDNPKNELGSSVFKNLMANLSLNENDLWDTEDKSLWNAKLFALSQTEEKALESAFILQKALTASIRAEEKDLWRNAVRLSLKESFEFADMQKTLLWQEELEDKVRISKFIKDISEGIFFGIAAKSLGEKDALERRLSKIAGMTEALPLIAKYRVYLALSKMVKTNAIIDNALDADFFEYKCFDTINHAIKDSLDNKTTQNEFTFALEEATEELPVRVNWGGGWSDTPPYCIEKGGTVLNAAISLKGKLPIKVTAKRLEKPVIVFESKDLKLVSEFGDLEKLQDYENPSDPFALHKAAIVAIGLIPAKGKSINVKERLTGAGGGLYLCTEVDVPKGSGLGTSSILAGGVIKALARIFGLEMESQKIFDLVLLLEQFITTGGGWQDQVGGLVGGIKLISSKAGLLQHITVSPLELSKETMEELEERFVLVYTGQRRLARNLLREITGKYILNAEHVVEILNKIQHLAVLMRYELEKGNVDNFISLINEHWELSKGLDSGSSNTFIDQIIEVSGPYIDGVFIAGAGGGGFLQFFLKKNCTKKELAKSLNEIYQSSGIEIWDTKFIF